MFCSTVRSDICIGVSPGYRVPLRENENVRLQVKSLNRTELSNTTYFKLLYQLEGYLIAYMPEPSSGLKVGERGLPCVGPGYNGTYWNIHSEHGKIELMDRSLSSPSGYVGSGSCLTISKCIPTKAGYCHPSLYKEAISPGDLTRGSYVFLVECVNASSVGQDFIFVKTGGNKVVVPSKSPSLEYEMKQLTKSPTASNETVIVVLNQTTSIPTLPANGTSTPVLAPSRGVTPVPTALKTTKSPVSKAIESPSRSPSFLPVVVLKTLSPTSTRAPTIGRAPVPGLTYFPTWSPLIVNSLNTIRTPAPTGGELDKNPVYNLELFYLYFLLVPFIATVVLFCCWKKKRV